MPFQERLKDSNEMRFFEILLEYRRDVTAQKLGDKLLASAKREGIKSVDQILAALEDMDPTPNKQYTLWIANQYNKGQFRLEDSPRIKAALERFIQAKSRLPEKDIGRYDFYQLEDAMEKIFNPDVGKPEPQTTVTFEIPNEIKNEVEVLYNGPLGLLVIPKTKKASCILGSGTRWCTAAQKDNMFSVYNRSGPLYIWRDKNGEKYQFHFYRYDPQFMDSKDRYIPKKQLKYFSNEHPVLKKMFDLEAKKLIKKVGGEDKLSVNDLDNFSRTTGKKSFPSEIINMIAKSPKLSFQYAADIIKGRFPEGEEAIAKSTVYAYEYSDEIIKRRFPLGEKAIAKDPQTAHYYAVHTIKGRFPEGEEAIAKSDYAYHYAKVVIKGRWPLGEKAIAKDPMYAYQYAKDVIKGRWPEGEKAIAKDSCYAYQYAKDVIKGRWPEGEKAIAKSQYYKRDYRDFIARKEKKKKKAAKKKK